MTAFSAAMRAIFRDPHMAADAVYRAGGTAPPITTRIIRRTPDEVASFGSSRIITETLLIDVLVADLADVASGDTFTVDDIVWTVSAAPRRDRDRLVWRIELVNR